MEMDEPPTVKTAANDFKQICYSYRDALMAGVIIAGWDRKNGGQVKKEKKNFPYLNVFVLLREKQLIGIHRRHLLLWLCP